MVPSDDVTRPKLWIVSVREPVFYGRLYRRIIQQCPERIGGVVLVPNPATRTLRGFVHETIYRTSFWGLRGFLYAGYRVVRALTTGNGDIARAARTNAIPVWTVAKISDAAALLRDNGAWIVLASVSGRIRQVDLAGIPGGWVNTHCGPLPRYGGLDAPFWCLFHREPNLTVTLHYMDPEFDSGPIIAQRSIVHSGETYFEAVDRLFDLAFEAHVEFAADLSPSREEARSQEPKDRTYFGKPSAALGRAFRRGGGRFA